MKIIDAKYKTSAVDENNLLLDDVIEFAFVGRSNVGKSSLINAVTNKKRLAFTSSTAGRTAMVNYFDISCEIEGSRHTFRLVDLPGYGYSKTGKAHMANWSGLIEKYLLLQKHLKTVFLLVDMSVTNSELDKMMVDFLIYYKLPFMIIGTKADKLPLSKIKSAKLEIAKNLGVREDIILPFSTKTKKGLTQFYEMIEGVLYEDNK